MRIRCINWEKHIFLSETGLMYQVHPDKVVGKNSNGAHFKVPKEVADKLRKLTISMKMGLLTMGETGTYQDL